LAINEQRVIDTSEVRVAGNYIMVNGKHVAPPYKIKAIVDPDNATNALNMIGGSLERIRLFIHVEVEKTDNLEIPKISEELIKTNKLTSVENK